MYWSHWDTAILWTGILTALLAALPVKVLDARARLLLVGGGGALIVISLITGNMQAFTYPQFVEIMWVAPIIGAVTIIYLNWKRSQNATVSATMAATTGAQAAPTAQSGAVPFVAVTTVAATTAEATMMGSLTHDQLLTAEARDPGTSLARLADLAHGYPELQHIVAANPSAYPELLAWLGQYGDESVQAALRARG
jgi:hypothetical protein